MRGPLVLCLLLSLALVGATNAAGPDEPVQAPATVTNDSVLMTQPDFPPDSFAEPAQTAVMSSDASCPCTDNGCGCGKLVGKYRCLWDTYCADRRECWRQACGQGSCGRSPCGTSCGKPSRALIVVNGTRCSVRKGHLHRVDCTVSNCDGCYGGPVRTDSVGTNGVVVEAAPTENGVPSEPTPADAGAPPEAAPNPPESEESLQPTPPAASETPATPDTKSASSRRTWWPKRSNNIPR